MYKKNVEKKAIIKHNKGIHARVAAMVVQKATELQYKYKTTLLFSYFNNEKVPATSFMLLVSLCIKGNDEIMVSGVGERADLAVEEMAKFLESDFDVSDKEEINETDILLHDNVFTAEQVFKSMANGLVVTDAYDKITVFNPSAEKIFCVAAKEVIGKKIYDVIPESRLHIVNKTQVSELGCRQDLGDLSFITNRTPIIVDKESRGAVAIYEDISELVKVSWELREIKELEKKLQLILESVHDGICVLDKNGYITYVNHSYLRILEENKNNLIGKNISQISPEGARSKVLATGKPSSCSISKKPNGVTIVTNVNPIIVGGEIAGVVSVVKNISELQDLIDKLDKISAKADYLEQELRRTKNPGKAFERYIGRSGKILDALAMARKAADGVSTVLIRGESGTGKELVAEGIHYSSPRKDGPFIRVNCAAIPSNLLESELFGHEKGAFTGAIKMKLGRFELANKGTIFLDEIGEMEKSMQAKLLRVLQQKEFQRVGGEKTIKVDVRFIAATNQDLEVMLANGDFREDLYYRLNVIPILLTPLRERKEDIPLLTEHFLNKVSKELGKEIKGIRQDALEVLMNYRWPGNIRELENIIERTVTLTDNKYIDINDLPIFLREGHNSMKDTGLSFSDEFTGNLLTWDEYEKKIIKAALDKHVSYNAAAKALGLTHKTVAAKAQRYGLKHE